MISDSFIVVFYLVGFECIIAGFGVVFVLGLLWFWVVYFCWILVLIIGWLCCVFYGLLHGFSCCGCLWLVIGHSGWGLMWRLVLSALCGVYDEFSCCTLIWLFQWVVGCKSCGLC